jgi:hypothetical protein
MLLLLLLLCGLTSARANTSDTQSGVLLGTSGNDVLVTLMLEASAERKKDREVADRRYEESERRHKESEQRYEVAEQRHGVAEQRRKVAEQRHEVAEQRHEVAEQRHEVAEQRHKVAEQRHGVAERRNELAERRHESQLQTNREISDAVVTATTSERVYTCAKAGGVLLLTPNWANRNTSMFCSATPLFSAQPQAESTYFLTSAHCFTDISLDKATFANFTTLYYRTLHQTCSLVHNFFCHPSMINICSLPSMDLAIVHCSVSVPVPSTHLSVLPQQYFQRVFIYGFSKGIHLDQSLMYFEDGSLHNNALHLKLARLAPSIQYPLPLNLTSTTIVQLLSTTTSSAGTATTAKLPQASYQGYLDIVPEQGMSGGPVVDSQCGLLGVTESRSIYGEGGSFVKLSPSVVQRIMSALGKL